MATQGPFIAVSVSRPSTVSAAATSIPSEEHNTAIFVGGLDPAIDEETLKNTFAQFGELVYVQVPPNKGCGYIQYANRIAAEAAFAMHGQVIGSQKVRLSWGKTSLGSAARNAQPVTMQQNNPLVMQQLMAMNPAMMQMAQNTTPSMQYANPYGLQYELHMAPAVPVECSDKDKEVSGMSDEVSILAANLTFVSNPTRYLPFIAPWEWKSQIPPQPHRPDGPKDVISKT